MDYDIYILTMPGNSNRTENLINSLNVSKDKLIIVEKSKKRFVIHRNVTKSQLDQHFKYFHIFKKIIQNNRSGLVLEDDAIASSEWKSILDKGIEQLKKYDCLFLSDDSFDHPSMDVGEGWCKTLHSKTTCATLFSPSGAKKIINGMWWVNCNLDWRINRIAKKRNMLIYWHKEGIFIHGSMHGMYKSLIKYCIP